MTIQANLYDITIIGGGPVGLFGAFYAGMRQAKTKIIESLGVLGGQPAHLYPEKKIFDIPAHYAVTGTDLTRDLMKQLERFDTTICLNEEAMQIEEIQLDDATCFKITTTKAVHYSKSVIIAIGNGAFRPRKLELPTAELYENHSLHYFVSDPMRFKDQIVAICGGGDSAVDWALTLEPIAKKVYLIHRRPQFRAMEHSVKQLEQSSVEILTPYIPVELHGTDQQLHRLKLQVPRQDEFKEISIDHFIVSYGFVSSIGSIAEWGLEMQRQTIVTNASQQTNRAGIYAVGDVAQYDGKVRLIANGFGEITTAVNHALNFLYPDRNKVPTHSSSLFTE